MSEEACKTFFQNNCALMGCYPSGGSAPSCALHITDTSQHGTAHECPSLGMNTSRGNAALGMLLTEPHITAPQKHTLHWHYCILSVLLSTKKKKMYFLLFGIHLELFNVSRKYKDSAQSPGHESVPDCLFQNSGNITQASCKIAEESNCCLHPHIPNIKRVADCIWNSFLFLPCWT